LITWVCLELNARALVSSWKVENLDYLNVGWLGGIYSPNHQTSRLVEAAVAWRTGQSGAPPDTVRCANHVTWPLELCLVGPSGCPVVHQTSPVDCPVCHPRVLCPLRAQARI
jgi:hypothetical protein